MRTHDRYCHRDRDLHVVLNRREERLQPFIRGGIRKVTGKDLEE